jgi:tetratricopeptide (TPR) repeat protein
LTEEEEIEYIDKYLEGALKGEELKSFEHLLSTDPYFSDTVKVHKELSSHYNNSGYELNNKNKDDFRAFLKSDESFLIRDRIKQGQELFENASRQKSKTTIPWYKIAAVCILFFTVGVLFFNTNSTSSEDLFIEHYSLKELPSLIQRNDQSTDLAKGIIYFNNNDFHNAIARFESYKRSTEDYSPLVLLYEGISLFELGKTKEALEKLDMLIALNTIENPRALWFKGLIQLKNGTSAQAQAIFKNLQKDASGYKIDEVNAILEALD